MFQFESEGRKRPRFQLKAMRQEGFPLISLLFCSHPQLIGWGLLTSGRAICFTQSANSNVSFIQKHPHIHPESYWTKYLGIPHPSQVGARNQSLHIPWQGACAWFFLCTLESHFKDLNNGEPWVNLCLRYSLQWCGGQILWAQVVEGVGSRGTSQNTILLVLARND